MTDYELYFFDDPNPPEMPLRYEEIDFRAIRELQGRIQCLKENIIPDLTERIADARSCGDIEKREKLEYWLRNAESECEFIQKQLESDTVGGRPRKMSDEWDSVRKTPRKNIKRFVAALRKELPDVADRLWDSLLHSKQVWHFVPKRDEEWVVEYRL